MSLSQNKQAELATWRTCGKTPPRNEPPKGDAPPPPERLTFERARREIGEDGVRRVIKLLGEGLCCTPSAGRCAFPWARGPISPCSTAKLTNPSPAR